MTPRRSTPVCLTGVLACCLPLIAANDQPNQKTVSPGRIYFLDITSGNGRLLSANADGSDSKVLVRDLNHSPDGVVVDWEHRFMYWTNMGKGAVDDGSLQRANVDGTNVVSIVPEGGTFTPKQLKLDKKNGKLYWADREGMRIMRSNLDGSNVETLVETGHGEADRLDGGNWCVGIALDVDRGQIYWTQKGNSNAGGGSIRRANMKMPQGEDPGHRSDIELLFDHLPEPIDMDLDLSRKMIYWSDRGDPPLGNTVNRAPMDAAKNQRRPPEVLVTGLIEGIGIALDVKRNRMFFTDLGGSVYSANLDGSDKKTLLSGQGHLVGIEYVEDAK